jgi:hypothetical protein
MGRFFLFREVIPRETSPITWGLKRQKIQGQVLEFPPHRLPPMSDSLANQPIKEVYALLKTPARNKTTTTQYIYLQAIIQRVSTSITI